MDSIIFEITRCLLVIAVITAVSYAGPYLVEKVNQIKDARIRKWVPDAVEWAEQTIKGEGKGAERKAKVMEFLVTLAFEKGWKITAEQIEILVEAAVKAMNGTN